MILLELIKSAYYSLRANKRRSLLSMLGIVIGIAAVVMILSISKGFQRNLNNTLTRSHDGKQTGVIYFSAQDSSVANQTIFNQSDLNLVRSVPGVDRVKVITSDGDQHTTKILMGTKKEEWLVEPVVKSKGTLIRGTGFNQANNELHQRVAVVSSEFAKQWQKKHAQTIGTAVNLNGFDYEIIGVFQAKTTINLFMNTTDIYVPKAAYDEVTPVSQGDGLLITMTTKADSKKILKSIARQLKERGSAKTRGTYEIQDNQQMASAVGKILKGITTFIGSVAGISLFIAGIGVMNMTYISVTERMPEIGIRRALGAKPNDITLQFLIEGTMLTSFGGLIGYFVGSALAVIIGYFLPFKVTFETGAFWLAFLISFAIGLAFSVGPARSATKKNLLELLR